MITEWYGSGKREDAKGDPARVETVRRRCARPRELAAEEDVVDGYPGRPGAAVAARLALSRRPPAGCL